MSDVFNYRLVKDGDGQYETTRHMNPDYVDDKKADMAEYMSGDDLGVITARYDEINEMLEREMERAEDGELHAAFGMGLALKNLVQELSEPSRTDTDPLRHAREVIDSEDDWPDLETRYRVFLSGAGRGEHSEIADEFNHA